MPQLTQNILYLCTPHVDCVNGHQKQPRKLTGHPRNAKYSVRCKNHFRYWCDTRLFAHVEAQVGHTHAPVHTHAHTQN